MISIADLPVVDDLNVPVSPEDYVDQANPAPAKPGNYRLVATKVEVATNKDGFPKLVDGKYPIIVIQQAKIVEPVENERGIGVFYDIMTKPFERKGSQGQAVVASGLQDMLRGYDETIGFDGFDHMKSLLQQYVEQNATFLAQLTWTGYDKAFADAEFETLALAGTPRDQVSKEVANAIYAKAKKGLKDFTVNGQLQASVVGPSGNLVEARLKLGRVFPSLTEFGKGKDAKGRARIVLGPFATK